ncbi:MAG: Nramp family divalent metal transporter [Candidatus Woesebacteria bacterium]|nr:MAG: Nramp family divalent metal transporter [Candidatus Woesebacteria bacterium]
MLSEHEINEMPEAPAFKKLLGPSFILLGLGLGSGELILWPYLTANFGMGIIWAAILGITLQFFINMEIERYSLVRGESIFVGFTRKFKYAPIWFIFSTLAGFVWPGIAAVSAKMIGAAFGITQTHFIAIGMLILMGLILTLGPVLYKTMERFSIILIGLGVPAIFILTAYLTGTNDWASLFRGVVGIGEGYNFLPAGIPIASFLAAFAFSGAGGNLNLAQSFYIKEKGYGMGKFGGRITSILTGEVENIKLEGTRFEMSKDNLRKFERWWDLINKEHFVVFLATGAFTISLLALLSYSTVFGSITPGSGFDFIIYEAASIARSSIPLVGMLFLIIGGIMLFSTQMTVMDATSRIMSENLLILNKHKWETRKLPAIYYSFLWAQIAFGILIFLTSFREPFLLLTLEAVINAGAMFIHIGATLYLNLTSLEREVRTSLPRILVMIFSFLFFGYFTVRTILQYI